MTERFFHAAEIGDRFGGVVHRHDLEGPPYDARLASPVPAHEAPLAMADGGTALKMSRSTSRLLRSISPSRPIENIDQGPKQVTGEACLSAIADLGFLARMGG